MLKLKNYSFSGIGRFVQKQTIDFENRDHLIQIDGENINTGGSSGAGKSTTAEALAYLLGISEVPATQLQSRITKDPIWVQGQFEDGITITRSKKDGLTIETPTETVSGNSKLAEEKLDEIIGVPRNLFKRMCYKRQKQGGFFLNLTPKESHDFLVDCLGLNDFQKIIEKLEDKIKNKYKPRKIELNGSVSSLFESLEQLKSLLEMKNPPEKPEEINLDEMKKNVLFIEQQIRKNKEEKEEKLSKLIKPLQPSGVIFDKQNEIDALKKDITDLKNVIKNNYELKQKEIDQASSAIFRIKSEIQKCNEQKNLALSLQKKVTKLKEEMEHYKKKNCPTCLRNWDEIGEDSVEKLQKEIDTTEKDIQECQDILSKIPHLKILEEKAILILESKQNNPINVQENVKLEELQKIETQYISEKQNIEEKNKNMFLEQMAIFNSLHGNISNEYDEKINKLNYEKFGLENQIDRVEKDQRNYLNAIETYQKDIKNIKDKIEQSSGRLLKEQAELDKIDKDILLSEESMRLIKDFTLQKFQDTLNYIGDRATQILNNIPNMANAVIYFENAKETQSGKIKNEVNAVLNLEGDQKIPIKTLSGGERTSADFAIDLAVGEMIESTTKKGANFLIIDEGFDGLDSVSKIECLEILKTMDTDKKILMVDHSSEVKQMVGDIIKVKRIGEESFVE